ncbi:DUF1653 domain-containing protein [bacterium]|jgi:hypothetical protein|nr:DUF1653 domain-containing protein [bacterium]
MTISPGIYHHYKGNDYEVLYTAKHSEDLSLMVVYRALYGNQDVWVRPATMFAETVTIDGKERPRFQLKSLK